MVHSSIRYVSALLAKWAGIHRDSSESGGARKPIRLNASAAYLPASATDLISRSNTMYTFARIRLKNAFSFPRGPDATVLYLAYEILTPYIEEMTFYML